MLPAACLLAAAAVLLRAAAACCACVCVCVCLSHTHVHVHVRACVRACGGAAAAFSGSISDRDELSRCSYRSTQLWASYGRARDRSGTLGRTPIPSENKAAANRKMRKGCRIGDGESEISPRIRRVHGRVATWSTEPVEDLFSRAPRGCSQHYHLIIVRLILTLLPYLTLRRGTGPLGTATYISVNVRTAPSRYTT